MKEKVFEHVICVDHISTTWMLVDPLTKGLVVGVYHDHIIKISLTKSFDVLGQWEYHEDIVYLSILVLYFSQDMLKHYILHSYRNICFFHMNLLCTYWLWHVLETFRPCLTIAERHLKFVSNGILDDVAILC